MNFIQIINNFFSKKEDEVVLTDWHDYNHFLPLEYYSFEVHGKLKIETFLSLHNHYLDTSDFTFHEVRSLLQILFGLTTVYCEPKNSLNDRNRYYIKNVKKQKIKYFLGLIQ